MHVPCAKRRRLALSKSLLILAITPVLWLAGCGERPPFPKWQQQTPTATEQVVLSDRLSVQDLRQLARAVNGSGKLRSLQPWVESISDDQLSILGNLVYDFIYQDALSQGSAVDLLEKRVDEMFFDDMGIMLELMAMGKDTGGFFPVVKTLIGHPKFPDVIDLNAHWLDLNWAQIGRLHKQRLEKMETEKEEEMPDPDAAVQLVKTPLLKGWVSELHQMLHANAVDKSLTDLSAQLQNTHFLGNSIYFLQQKQKTAADLNGFLATLRTMAITPWKKEGQKQQQQVKPAGAPNTEKTQLMVLLETLDKLNGPTDGLFGKIHKVLDTSDVGRELGNMFQPLKNSDDNDDNNLFKIAEYQPIVARVIHGYVRREITRGGNGSFNQDAAFWRSVANDEPEARKTLYNTVLMGVQKVSGLALPSNSEGSAKFNLPIYVNSYVISEYLRQYAKSAITAWEKIPEAKFADRFWSTSVEMKAFELTLTDASGVMTTAVQNDFKALIDDTSEALEKDMRSWEETLKITNTKSWVFAAPARKRAVLADSLKEAVENTDKVLAFADISAVLRMAFFFATEPGSSGKSPLQELDGNFLDKMNTQLAGFSKETLQLLSSLISNSGTLPQLIGDLRIQFQMVLGEDLGPRANEIWDSLQTLAELFSSKELEKAGFNTAFVTYIQWLQTIGPESIPALGSTLGFVKSAKVFDSKINKGKAELLYPAMVERILGSDTQAPSLLSFAHWISPEIFELERGIRQSVSLPGNESAMGVYLDWLRALPPQKNDSWDGIATLMNSASGGVKDEERLWISHFIRRKGLHRTWDFFGNNASWSQSSGLVQELVRLAEQGSLTAPLDLLESIRDDRIKRIARVIKKWYHSGQFLRFLKACEKLIQHSPGPI